MHKLPFRSATFVLILAPVALGTGAFVFPTHPNPVGDVSHAALAVIEKNCLSCHSGERPAGGLLLLSRAGLLKGGKSGKALAPNPEQSLLLRAVNYRGPQMPPSGRLPQADIDAITSWIRAGATWPSDVTSLRAPGGRTAIIPPQVTPETMHFWSFQPVRRPAIPTVRNRDWVRNPIDAFVLSKLEAAGLKPALPASPAALIRRATYDLVGIPPTPEEVRAFISDRSPDAYDKLIDRLLASPQYGEKWGRHWLDLVRYAETDSYERDAAKPNAWRYRDYVIQSLNADKPYDQFILEQLAGDELPARTPEHLIATGYYRLGIWDDEPVDPLQARYDDLDDIVRTTGETFLGLTVGCARCHDHKIDPIPQKDYYRFVALFNGMNRYGDGGVEHASLRSIAAPAEVARHQVEVNAFESKLRQNGDAMRALESPILPHLTEVEMEQFKTDTYKPRVLRLYVGKQITQADFDRYEALIAEKAKIEASKPAALTSALCVTEIGPNPKETFVCMRGNPHVEGDRVEPGFLSVLNPPAPGIQPGPFGDTSGRRLALARWIASRDNPLTARVIVNRVWKYHFGRGIVRTPSDFGFQGARPTHPELLDWLADTFVSGRWVVGSSGDCHRDDRAASETSIAPGPWSLKSLHRLIMLSSTYRMSCQPAPIANLPTTQRPNDPLSRDPENDLMSRFDMRRLEAEEVRDSILAVNGSLNPQMGGPSVYATIPDEVLAGQSLPGSGWGKSTPDQENRRSIYIHVKRSLIVPMVANFDGPETDFTCPARFATTQPTQALGMLNSAFVNQEARKFAQFLTKEAGADTNAQVRLALWRVMQREPSAAETARGVALVESLKQKGATPPDALARFCVVALNLNEFLYLD